MPEPTSIIDSWIQAIEKNHSRLHPKVLPKRNEIAAEEKLSIWLGGPGNSSRLFPKRFMLKNVLEHYSFEVVFSEDFQGGSDLVSKEIEEIEVLDLIFILIVTPGAAGEAIEFIHSVNLNKKLHVFIPHQYSNGYIYQSLMNRHTVLPDNSLFCQEGFENDEPELAIKVVDRAIAARNYAYWNRRLS